MWKSFLDRTAGHARHNYHSPSPTEVPSRYVLRLARFGGMLSVKDGMCSANWLMLNSLVLEIMMARVAGDLMAELQQLSIRSHNLDAVLPQVYL